jgi:hypothetical protein
VRSFEESLLRRARFLSSASIERGKRLTLVQTVNLRVGASIQLTKALGGGWENNRDSRASRTADEHTRDQDQHAA